MAVLVIIVMFLGRAFNDAATSFRRAATTVERNGAVQIALDRIRADIESMVVNERVACCQLRNTTDPNPGFGYDEVWFVTTQGDQDERGSLMFVRYFVESVTNTHMGLEYISFRLWKHWWYYDTLRDHTIDPLGADREWWIRVKAEAYGETNWLSGDIVAENLVRIDIWMLGNDGNPVGMPVPGMGAPEGGFRSTMDSANYTANQHPAYMDLYLQVTSDETMRQAGRIMELNPNPNASERLKARAQMIRDSNVLITRVYPIMSQGQRDHPYTYWY